VRTLLTALRDLRASPLRNLLTALSMLVGVLAVVAVSAADQLVVGAVVAEEEQQHGRSATYETSLPGGRDALDRAQRLTESVRRSVDRTDVAVTLVVDEQVVLRGDPGAPTPVALTWVDGSLQSTYRRPAVVGTWPALDSTTAPAFALNAKAAAELGVVAVPAVVRWDVAIERVQSITVTAVLADGRDEATAYASLPLSAGLRGGGATPDTAPRLLVTSPSVPLGVLQQVVTDAAARSGTTEPLEMRRVDTVADTRQTVATARAALLLCGITALAVAVLGILNVGLATVKERSRELVVRRALGARRRDVVAQVIGAASAVSLVVAVLAVSVVLVAVVAVVPRTVADGAITDPVTVPWSAVRDGIVAALLTGFVGALAPALSASRLPVADALRA
jgi:ABC-type antimicrobial peptide transport system permease subunit